MDKSYQLQNVLRIIRVVTILDWECAMNYSSSTGNIDSVWTTDDARIITWLVETDYATLFFRPKNDAHFIIKSPYFVELDFIGQGNGSYRSPIRYFSPDMREKFGEGLNYALQTAH